MTRCSVSLPRSSPLLSLLQSRRSKVHPHGSCREGGLHTWRGFARTRDIAGAVPPPGGPGPKQYLGSFHKDVPAAAPPPLLLLFLLPRPRPTGPPQPRTRTLVRAGAGGWGRAEGTPPAGRDGERSSLVGAGFGRLRRFPGATSWLWPALPRLL